ncbi:hypothetical protein Cgig2_017372 [Carnegiea gigantea]|uniref:Transmembrane 9 superfamily member n=1 Tax=Carnegiea gigantea TaxID=171969 RepID=A0A9Q1QCD0_9CARY|nr:hypothetical protein Cgig2_017372 [Carnegiea gigantea]
MPTNIIPTTLILFSLLLSSSPAIATESDHKNWILDSFADKRQNREYEPSEQVILWVNKVGPYNNPQETYNYYSLPFCRPAGDPAHRWGGLGEVLGGNELIDSQLDVKFGKNTDKTTICELELDAAKVKQFKDAIENSYWFEFFIGFVGELHYDKNSENTKHVLYTNKNVIIKYNGNQIIHVNLTQDSAKPVEEGRVYDMTYTVRWIPTNVNFARRFDVYLDYPFFEHQIHWFSIFNSFMMVIFLTGLVSMILMRTLRNDYAKYAREDDDLETLERDVGEESGWKLVHGDVFRPPRTLAMLSALVGNGAQLATLVLLVIILAIVGMLYVGRGAIVTTFIVCYALTSFISGYVSGSMYSRNGGKSWIKAMILTASLFPFMCFGIGFILNTIAIFYGSLAAIPFGTIVVVLVIWAFISFPLALLGTVVGRNWSGAPNNPCRVKTIPRPIPEKKWYLTPSVISLMGGLLPFGSIFIEMYFVFTSFWNYKVYYVYGFMLLVFLILIIVTVCVTIVGTYFLLNAENYHWQWTSFLSAASTAIYVYLYSVYYYHVKTKMSGFFQTSFYFGYTLMFCLGLGILCDLRLASLPWLLRPGGADQKVNDDKQTTIKRANAINLKARASLSSTADLAVEENLFGYEDKMRIRKRLYIAVDRFCTHLHSYLDVMVLPVTGIAGIIGSVAFAPGYEPDEQVTLWVNKVGPYNNPQETYNYFSLPFCQPQGNAAHRWGGLGEVLGGNELIDSQLDIKFRKNVDRTSICELELDASKARQFKDAIENSYWFEFFIGFVGELRFDKNSEHAKHLLYTNKNFIIKYNGNQIIHVNLTQDNAKPVEEGRVYDMTYTVKWIPTNVPFARRFDVYLDYPFFEHQIHWFSIFNSFMMVIFLTGLVSMILMRTLRNDYAKYAREDDDLESLERDVSEESGWKLVHGDVFRPPRNLALLSALIGTGAQLVTLVLLVIIVAIVGTLYIGRGAIVTAFIVCYALTSFIAGYVSGGMYGRNGGKNWIKSMILTASLFPFMCFGIGFILNTIAIFYGSLAAIPFGTMVVVFVIWAFISFPLALLGTVVGRNWNGAPNNPCRVKTIPRPIPEKKWYLTPSVISLMGGLLPFGSIFIEMYFVFTSFWNYKVYYVYGFMLLVFIILIIVTVCVTIVGTYFLLNAENYHWQWTSFFSAASTAIYVYLYSIYYYHVKTKMSGFFQTSFYFGYTMMFCLGLGMLCEGYTGTSSVISGPGVLVQDSVFLLL